MLFKVVVVDEVGLLEVAQGLVPPVKLLQIKQAEVHMQLCRLNVIGPKTLNATVHGRLVRLLRLLMFLLWNEQVRINAIQSYVERVRRTQVPVDCCHGFFVVILSIVHFFEVIMSP